MTMQRPLERVTEDTDTTPSRVGAEEPRPEATREPWPPIDVFREGNRFVIAADLPGVAADQVTVRISALEIRLIGERTRRLDSGNRAYEERERLFGRFERAIRLPRPVQPHTASAYVEDGVLTFEAELEAEPAER